MKSDDLQRFLASVRETAPVNVLMAQNWVEDFQRVTRELATVDIPHFDSYSVFWIRLHGVLTELVEGHRALIDAHQVDAPGALSPADVTAARHIVDCVDDMRTALSEAELIFADYMRQTQVHVLQRGFELKVRGKKGNPVGLKETYFVHSLGKTFSISHLNSAIDRIFESGGRDERRLAIEYAKAMVGYAKTLHEAFTAMSPK